MAFVDEVRVYAKAGDGGDGAVAWRREAHTPMGGPAGGDGGNGGDVVFVAVESVRSLIDFRFRPHVYAEDGQKGMNKNMFGRAGKDIVARVPVGTQITDLDTGAFICDLTEAGQRFVVCKGGSGGHGNTRFTTASRQAPDFAKPGLPGEERTIRLSLKLMADVGLLGFPNAGKSTFLATVSAAKPKIAAYPFTTLAPQLGVVKNDDLHFIIADIPGIIEGAAAGAGLGFRFLKHLERVRVLLHLVEATNDGFAAPEDGECPLLRRYKILRAELAQYSDELAALPEMVVVSKIDAIDDDEGVVRFERAMHEHGVDVMRVSSATHVGIEPVLYKLYELVEPPKEENTDYDPFRGSHY